ncbi:alanine dehydrogenase [Saccharothrix tamanrassetensis]|uniref:Alanine dehydrogenase n=1 Tax=Saccharothrix tamanrassetensis TaxID=1051531 RepID=A0A841CVA6_9PSEU|nr:hypothetical protein [Saccharothrix tamanrassetensis]MBB5959336.1 alanine dehydrogenase [Saccharothrix tamanrassetensis]
MLVGIPGEVENHEYRVAITPAGVVELVRRGHRVPIESGAGDGSSIPDAEYQAAGARIVPDADDVWSDAELVLKVKEPVAEEFHRMRPAQTLFTYLHLAANAECTRAVVASGIDAIAYETVQLADGSLPLPAPMSEVAGRMAAQVGAYCLERTQGGRGVLLGGVPGVPAGKVVVLGAGVGTFQVHGSVFYCVANMPGAVPHTSTWALTNVTLPYVTALADKGFRQAVADDPAPARGVNAVRGTVVRVEVAKAHNLPHVPVARL